MINSEEIEALRQVFLVVEQTGSKVITSLASWYVIQGIGLLLAVICVVGASWGTVRWAWAEWKPETEEEEFRRGTTIGVSLIIGVITLAINISTILTYIFAPEAVAVRFIIRQVF